MDGSVVTVFSPSQATHLLNKTSFASLHYSRHKEEIFPFLARERSSERKKKKYMYTHSQLKINFPAPWGRDNTGSLSLTQLSFFSFARTFLGKHARVSSVMREARN